MMRYDVIIVGGGLVGAGLALALHDTNLQIALIDARVPTATDPRLFALSSSSCHFLAHLGLWPGLSPYAAPIHDIHVSYQGRFGSVRLKRRDLAVDSLGHVIPAYLIEQAMQEQLAKTQVKLFQPATLTDIHQDTHLATLTLNDAQGEKQIQAPIVIGADGTNSAVRAQLTIETDEFDYEQSAIVTRTQLRRSHEQIAYERFTSDGAIAMLPLVGNECATIWTVHKEKAAELMNLSDNDFLQRLQAEFGFKLGRLQAIASRHSFPLRMVRAEKSVQQSVFLLGNSAHTLPPIAAQGFNLAIYEVAMLTEKIKEKCAAQEAISMQDLISVNEQTQKQQAVSMGVSHRLARWFSQPSLLMDGLLQLGMLGLDRATPLKRIFMRGMMGQRGRIPQLLLPPGDYSC